MSKRVPTGKTFVVDHVSDWMNIPDECMQDALLDFIDFLVAIMEAKHRIDAKAGETKELPAGCVKFKWTDDGKNGRTAMVFENAKQCLTFEENLK